MAVLVLAIDSSAGRGRIGTMIGGPKSSASFAASDMLPVERRDALVGNPGMPRLQRFQEGMNVMHFELIP